MEFKTVTRKVLTLSTHEKGLLKDAAILLSRLFQEDIINQLFNQVTDKVGMTVACDFEDMANILHELANGEYIIKEIK